MPHPRPPYRLPPSWARAGRGACLLALVLATIALAVLPAPAAASAGWQRPVPGAVSRGFDYAGDPFAAGRHRGVDFAVRRGVPVRSACSGRVVFAGVAGSNGPTVSVRCGAWRVAYLPLATLAVTRGARVGRGARLGTAAAAGLHVGVRREGRRWAYVDPLPFFGPPAPPPLPLGPLPRAARRPPAGGPVRIRAPRRAPLPEAHAPRARPVPDAPRGLRGLAPWPAWAGLALVLAGASGAGVSRQRRRAPRPRASAEPAISRASPA